MAQLLANRNVTDHQEAQKFLACSLAGMHEPERMPGLTQACERIGEAIRDGKRICVYGDYDVDGVTGTAILLNGLSLLGANLEFHVPHRLEDGYGLSTETLRKLAAKGVQVVVTVDCGIASLAEAEVALELGVELIVTDHHEPKATLPRASCIVHPRVHQGQEPYPCGSLSGRWRRVQSDLGPLQAEVWQSKGSTRSSGVPTRCRGPCSDGNRRGCRSPVRREPYLRQVWRATASRKTLGGASGTSQMHKLDAKESLSVVDIGYAFALRINAAGRLGTARLAVELFTTKSQERAAYLADFLERQNQERQQIERKILQEARDLAEQAGDVPALVLASENWHPGLLGIVASRLVDQYARPVLMIALRGEAELGQGSGRSVPGFKLHEALRIAPNTWSAMEATQPQMLLAFVCRLRISNGFVNGSAKWRLGILVPVRRPIVSPSTPKSLSRPSPPVCSNRWASSSLTDPAILSPSCSRIDCRSSATPNVSAAANAILLFA